MTFPQCLWMCLATNIFQKHYFFTFQTIVYYFQAKFENIKIEQLCSFHSDAKRNTWDKMSLLPIFVSDAPPQALSKPLLIYKKL